MLLNLSRQEIIVTLLASALMVVPYYLAYWYGKRRGRFGEIKRRREEKE